MSDWLDSQLAEQKLESSLDASSHTGLRTGGLQSSGLQTTGLQTSGLGPAQQDPSHIANQEKRVQAAEQALFKEDLSGKRGIAGMFSAISDIASQVVARALLTLNIVGDGTVNAHRSGSTWTLSYNPPVKWETPPGAAQTKTPPQPFQLIPADLSGVNRVRVVASYLVDDLPDDMNASDNPAFYLAVSNGEYIYARITIDNATGEVLSRTIENAVTIPDDTATDFHTGIGFVTVTGGATSAVNYRYGPISAVIILNWAALPTDDNRYNVYWDQFKYSG